LNTKAFIPILVVGVVTLAYSMQGGLYISMLTDQIQASFVWALLIIVTALVAVNFHPGPLPSTFPDALGVTEMGFGSFVTVGFALIASNIFSDSIW
jgi:hypothetical protein